MRLLSGMLPRWPAQLGLAAAAWGGCGWARAQSPVLENLKKAHAEEVAKAVLPLREKYLTALQGAETRLAAKGDYAGARRVQEERRQMDRLTGRPTGPASAGTGGVVGSGVVKLGLAGEGGGGLRVEGGSWTGWQAAGGFIRWVLPAGLRGGGYSLEFVYSSAGEGRLGLTMREDFHSLNREVQVAAAPLPGAPEGRFRVETLRLRPGATLLEIKLSAATSVADFRLHELRLIPEETLP